MNKYIIGMTNNKDYIFYFCGNKNTLDPTVYKDQCTLVDTDNIENAIHYFKERIRIMSVWKPEAKTEWKIFKYNYSKEHIFNIKYYNSNIYGVKVYSINVSIPKLRKQKIININEYNS